MKLCVLFDQGTLQVTSLYDTQTNFTFHIV